MTGPAASAVPENLAVRLLSAAAGGGWARRCGFVIAVWALLYLPGLTTLEVDTDEVRRIYPAQTMLATGEWAVPVFAGQRYFRKPPLYNWLLAGAIRVAGQVNELVVRLPTTLAVLFFALLVAGLSSAWLDPRARFLAALVILSSAGFLESGRVAGIDCWYAVTTGLAILLWANAFAAGNTGLRLWLPPGLVLGFGLLLKGPLVLLFFYVAVGAVLWRGRALRQLAAPGHFLAVAVMLGIFYAWYRCAVGDLPEHRSGGYVSGVWAGELWYRLNPRNLDAGKWVRNVLGAVLAFLPWALFLPRLWRGRDAAGGATPLAADLRLAGRRTLVVFFAMIALMPETKARYLLPAFPLAALLLAPHFLRTGGTGEGAVVHWWRRGIALAVTLLAVAGALALPAIVLLRHFPSLAPLPACRPLVAAVAGLGPAGLALAAGASVAAVLGLFLRLHRPGPASSGVDFRFAAALWLVVAGWLLWAAYGLPARQQSRHGQSREFAAAIQARVPRDAVLRIRAETTGEPFLFYLNLRTQTLPPGSAAAERTGYWLVADSDLKKLAAGGAAPREIGPPLLIHRTPFHLLRWDAP